MGRHDLVHDGQPKTDTPSSAGASLVEAGKSLQDPCSITLGDARAVVRDNEHSVTALGVQGDHYLACREAGCVLQQVADRT